MVTDITPARLPCTIECRLQCYRKMRVIVTYQRYLCKIYKALSLLMVMTVKCAPQTFFPCGSVSR